MKNIKKNKQTTDHIHQNTFSIYIHKVLAKQTSRTEKLKSGKEIIAKKTM